MQRDARGADGTHVQGRSRLSVLLASAALAGLGAPAAAAADTAPTPVERRVVALFNNVRAQRGLPRLQVAPSLTRAARAHSQEMLGRGYFAHSSASGERFDRRVRRFAVLPLVGEIIGWGSGPLGGPESVVRAWMGSPGHRAILLDPAFRVVGVGRAGGTFQGWRSSGVYTADFGAGPVRTLTARRPQRRG